MLRVLVTGSSGFIGGHLFEALKTAKLGGFSAASKLVGVSRRASRYPWDIILMSEQERRLGGFLTWEERTEEVNCDLSLETQVASLMARYQPDAVFHFAGDPLIRNGGPAVSVSNYLTTHHLLTHAKEGCRFVLASSAAVYGDPRYPGQRFHENDLLLPTSAYGAAKAGAEHLVRAFTKQGRVRGLSLRLAATVGKGATHGLVPDLVRKLKSPSPTLDLLGDYPGSRKPFTHVDDVVAGVVKLGFGTAAGVVNLALGDEISVQEAAHAVMDAIDLHKPTTWSGPTGTWKGDNPVVRIDSGDAGILGWEPRYRTSREAVTQAVRDLAVAA